MGEDDQRTDDKDTEEKTRNPYANPNLFNQIAMDIEGAVDQVRRDLETEEDDCECERKGQFLSIFTRLRDNFCKAGERTDTQRDIDHVCNEVKRRSEELAQEHPPENDDSYDYLYTRDMADVEIPEEFQNTKLDQMVDRLRNL